MKTIVERIANTSANSWRITYSVGQEVVIYSYVIGFVTRLLAQGTVITCLSRDWLSEMSRMYTVLALSGSC